MTCLESFAIKTITQNGCRKLCTWYNMFDKNPQTVRPNACNTYLYYNIFFFKLVSLTTAICFVIL